MQDFGKDVVDVEGILTHMDFENIERQFLKWYEEDRYRTQQNIKRGGRRYTGGDRERERERETERERERERERGGEESRGEREREKERETEREGEREIQTQTHSGTGGPQKSGGGACVR